MYLRPGNLGRDFIIERKTAGISASGRTAVTFEPTGEVLHGVLSNAKTSEIQKWQQLQHDITHTVIQRAGGVRVDTGDRLNLNCLYFYIQGVDDISALGLFVLYYVEERAEAIV